MSWGQGEYAPSSGREAKQMLQALIPYFFAACAALAIASLGASLRAFIIKGRAIARAYHQEL